MYWKRVNTDFNRLDILAESIKCHHNDIANYLLNQEIINDDRNNKYYNSIRYYNFHFLPDNINEFNDNTFLYICKYNYFEFFKMLKANVERDVKSKALRLAALKNNCKIMNMLISERETLINKDTFKHCEKIIELTLPSYMTKIESYAFDHCSSLTKISLPDSITEIKEGAFNDCDSLKKIILPPSINKIDKRVFQNCGLLEEVVIPPSVTEIESTAFCGCKNLRIINIPSTLTIINLRIINIPSPSTLTIINLRIIADICNIF